MDDVRPIGTEFTHVFAASMTSTNPCPHKATYRVVGHCESLDEFGNVRRSEELKCIKYEELPAPVEIPLRALKRLGHYQEWQQEYAESCQ